MQLHLHWKVKLLYALHYVGIMCQGIQSGVDYTYQRTAPGRGKVAVIMGLMLTVDNSYTLHQKKIHDGIIYWCCESSVFDLARVALRIKYVHKMAHFRMKTQLKDQFCAFLCGFHSMIPKHWISCFSPKELQRVISGDNVELDVDDLRYVKGYACV